ncbi:MAG: NADH-quinone oxidoreductase subunit M [Gammaproteobacteria bacterium]|nr:NADH-quinone oxidoreductase subunit M [Gammaproteobacteria bacterium]
MDILSNLLSILIWLPIIGGFMLVAIGDDNNPGSFRATMMKVTALFISLINLFLSIGLYVNFDNSVSEMQFVEKVQWIDSLNAFYFLGIDGISAPLILLTTFITPLVVISSWEVIKKRPAHYFSAFLILEGLMIGVFSALDALLFYVFWESMLIPMFLIIGIWGGAKRVYATLKFFLYTFLGSVLMLIAFIYLYIQTNNFDLLDFMKVPLSLEVQKYIFVAFLLAFAVKVPMWPAHTWLPDAHVEAPTGGSVILAAIMLKMGGYGFIRLSLPIVPDGSEYFSNMMIILSLIAIVYIGFVALAQKDMKKLIAYSSIAHMGFVTLGFFIFWSFDSGMGSGLGVVGAMIQMISHGLISGAMFICVGVLYDRMHSRNISDYGGVANKMPIYAAFMVLFAMANAGLPGTSGFVGEFMVILASFKANFWYAFFSAATLILSAAYTLWMVKRVIYGEVLNDKVAALQDVNAREFFVLAVLGLSVLMMGLWPMPLVEMMNSTIDQLIEQIQQTKIK